MANHCDSRGAIAGGRGGGHSGELTLDNTPPVNGMAVNYNPWKESLTSSHRIGTRTGNVNSSSFEEDVVRCRWQGDISESVTLPIRRFGLIWDQDDIHSLHNHPYGHRPVLHR